MVTRCGFYLKDGEIIQRNILIDWDLGFDTYAKRRYIERIQEKLKHCVKVVDVTTAAPNWETRQLSPFYVKLKDDISVEDYWNDWKVVHPERVPGLFDYLYLNALTVEQVTFVLNQEGFIDVFHNPEKAYNTQAKSLVCLQLLAYQGKLRYLRDVNEFCSWYKENCIDVKIVS